MAQFPNAFHIRAAQHLTHVGDAEPLSGANDGRQDFLGDDRGVELLPGRETHVASPAVVLLPVFAKIGQQIFSAAGLQVAELDHPRQLVPRVPLLGRVFYLVDEEILFDLVAVGIK